MDGVLGYTADELRGRPYLDLVHPGDAARTAGEGARVADGADGKHFENRYRAKDGRWVWLQWRSHPVVADGIIYAVARDVTAQKELEARALAADHMASVSALAAGIAHEMGAPLAFLVTNLQLARDELAGLGRSPRVAEVDAMLADADEGLQRVRSLVRDLRALSPDRERAATPRAIDIAPLVQRAVKLALVDVRHRARVVTEFGALPSVYADEGHVAQLVLGLVMHAARNVVDTKHEIAVRTFTDDEGRGVVAVKDTGPVESAGTLGVTTCARIASMMGGALLVAPHALTLMLPPARAA